LRRYPWPATPSCPKPGGVAGTFIRTVWRYVAGLSSRPRGWTPHDRPGAGALSHGANAGDPATFQPL